MNHHDAEVEVRKFLTEMESLHVSVVNRVDPYAVVGPNGIPRATLSEVINMFVNKVAARDTGETE
jgi:hypothetical protein